eukprot:403377542
MNKKALDPRFAQQFSEDEDDHSHIEDSDMQEDIQEDEDNDIESQPDNEEQDEEQDLQSQVDDAKELEAEHLLNLQKANNRGVCYLPRIPPFMNPMNLRKLMSNRFQIERIYLGAEAEHVTKQRRKQGGNHKTKYTEGWIEFTKKSEAKMAALALNGTQIGGKKRRNLFYDDIWTIKYLPKFKWQHLTEKLAYDQKVREQRLKTQNAQAKKEINFYMEKVDLKKKLDKMEEKKQKKMDKQQHNANEADESDDNDQKDDGVAELGHEKKKKKNLVKIMKYNQRKRREFKQRTPVM